MKNLIGKFVYGGDARSSALFVIGILVFVGLGCFGGKSGSSKAVPPAYIGEWKGRDGSTISIRGDGKGDYKSGSTTVDGGTVSIDDAKNELSITFFNIGPSLKIDNPPSGDQMTLNGIVYRRNGGGSTTVTDTKNAPDAAPDSKSPVAKDDKTDGDTPSNSEVEALVKSTLADFAKGVEQEDFIILYGNASRDFQASYAAPQLKNSFAVFITKKAQVVPILESADDLSAQFSSPPSVRTEKGFKLLTANGEFPTRPNATKFETEYELQNGSWKMLKFKVEL